MKPEVFFTDARGRIHATPENAAREDISHLLNVPAGVAERVVANFGLIVTIMTDMRAAIDQHGPDIKARDPKVIQIAPRRKTTVPAACRAREGE